MSDDVRTCIAKVLYRLYAEDIPYQTENTGDNWDGEGESYRDSWLRDADAVIRKLDSQGLLIDSEAGNRLNLLEGQQ